MIGSMKTTKITAAFIIINSLLVLSTHMVKGQCPPPKPTDDIFIFSGPQYDYGISATTKSYYYGNKHRWYTASTGGTLLRYYSNII
jgi:hypothetical protein